MTVPVDCPYQFRLLSDGLLGYAWPKWVRSGEESEFRAPVLIGDTITAQRRLGAVEEKDGRSGPFVLLHYETTFTNQHGDVVAVSRLVGIAR